jgi:hypothetical protein
MTRSQVEPQPQSIPSVTVPAIADHSSFERLAFLKTFAALADPLRSETVKGWLLGELRAAE